MCVGDPPLLERLGSGFTSKMAQGFLSAIIITNCFRSQAARERRSFCGSSPLTRCQIVFYFSGSPPAAQAAHVKLTWCQTIRLDCGPGPAICDPHPHPPSLPLTPPRKMDGSFSRIAMTTATPNLTMAPVKFRSQVHPRQVSVFPKTTGILISIAMPQAVWRSLVRGGCCSFLLCFLSR